MSVRYIRTIRLIVLMLSMMMTGFVTGKISMVKAAVTVSPSGWVTEPDFTQVTLTTIRTTPGCTIVKQNSGSSSSRTSSRTSSSSSSDQVLKIPDYFTVTYTADASGSGSGTTAQSYTYRIPVTALADNVFYDNDTVEEVVIPSTCKKVGSYAFYNCRNLKKIIIPSSVTELGEGAFEYCTSLKSVTIPSSISEIKRHAFFQCASLDDLTFMLPSTVEKLGPSAFSGCSSLAKVVLPASVQEISDDTFENCTSLTDFTILTGMNNNVTIGRGAFEGCTGLKIFTIPDSVTIIGSHAFWNCTSLSTVYFPDSYDQANLSTDVFEGCPSTLTLVSGKGSNVRDYAANRGIRFKYRTGGNINYVVLNTYEMTWTGRICKPGISGVYDVDGKMLSSSDFTVVYTNCKNVGHQATVTVTANEWSAYSGSASATFTIKPRNVKFSKKSTANRSITLKWKKKSEADGYEIQYARDSNFKKSRKTIKIKNNKTVSRVITSLKKGKNYYARIRSYKTADGEKIYSPNWSGAVRIKVK